jgi:hypothetical protein
MDIDNDNDDHKASISSPSLSFGGGGSALPLVGGSSSTVPEEPSNISLTITKPVYMPNQENTKNKYVESLALKEKIKDSIKKSVEVFDEEEKLNSMNLLVEFVKEALQDDNEEIIKEAFEEIAEKKEITNFRYNKMKKVSFQQHVQQHVQQLQELKTVKTQFKESVVCSNVFPKNDFPII